jgi:2-oxo-3-hexenedioate decarboxylase
MSVDPKSLAQELIAAYANRRVMERPPSARDAGFDLAAAYAVEAELVRARKASGHATVGRKVGFANKALWRVLKLKTLVWAHMYDDTVHYAENGAATLSIAPMYSPKIEPELVFKLKSSVDGDPADPSAVLGAVEWFALGFEIIDCVFPDWKFQPPDFVASFGLHAALVVGEPTPVRREGIAGLAAQLADFTVMLSKDGELVEEGAGKNSLRSPALCLGELASAIARRADDDPLAAGELISSGTLTESRPITRGETWSVRAAGLDVASLTLRVSASAAA